MHYSIQDSQDDLLAQELEASRIDLDSPLTDENIPIVATINVFHTVVMDLYSITLFPALVATV